MKCGCCILFLKDFLFTFFKTAGKDVTLRQNEMMIMMVREQVKKRNDLTSCKKPKKESYSTDCV